MTKQQNQLLTYLRGKRAGDTVTGEEILRETRWSAATLRAYRSKHYIDPFLTHLKGDRYRILRNGAELTEQDIESAFTQVRPQLFVPAEGLELPGSNGSYELKASLGRGAVAQVWRCSMLLNRGSEQLLNMSGGGSEFAAKVMSPREDLLDPKIIENVRQRFSREARNGRSLSHPHLIRYRDYGEVDGHPFLIMDLAERSVATILKGGPMTVSDSLPIIENCLQALKYLHGENCKHRDVKPANMLQVGSRFLLGDLGIVKWCDMNPSFTSAGTITRDSLQLGSWYYMAPEQRQAPHEASTASDVYALGISWYELLTLKTPDPSFVAVGRFPLPSANSIVNKLIREMVAFEPGTRPSVMHLIEQIGVIKAEASAPQPAPPA